MDSPDKPFDEMKEYRMSSMPRGICVIFNNMDFEEHNKKNVKPHLDYRRGSEKDEDSLKNVFSWLGFTVKVHRDKRAKEMKDLLKKVSQTDHVGDCFVCCILSHGCPDGVYGTDGGVVLSDDIFGPFGGRVCPSLAGKPKVFFIQACRGNDYQRRVEVQADSMAADRDEDEEDEEFEMDTAQMITIPNDGDFLVARSTVKGFVSVRNPLSGTWFIQSLCEQLRNNCPKCKDVQSILICVNEEVSKKIATMQINYGIAKVKQEVKQMPVQKVTLRKTLVFRVPSSAQISSPS
ncbi:caspase-8-like isoform X2 [Salminus brasiliensis]|uniref:caspase-8-like isoform X2 n=1 Tax=Salminus brasiliensis TaxID=930266 RepID=UPI003B839049